MRAVSTEPGRPVADPLEFGHDASAAVGAGAASGGLFEGRALDLHGHRVI